MSVCLTHDVLRSHKFHQQCIREWLPESTTCPVCRFSYAKQCTKGSFEGLGQGRLQTVLHTKAGIEPGPPPASVANPNLTEPDEATLALIRSDSGTSAGTQNCLTHTSCAVVLIFPIWTVAT